MKRRKPFSMLSHAVSMVGRMIKSYAMLSVTIVLSFSLLLCYLLYTDSAIYNEHKELFSYRRGDVTLNLYDQDSEKLQLLRDNLDEMANTDHYVYYAYTLGNSSTRYSLETEEGRDPWTVRYLWYRAWLLPDHAWPEGARFAYYEDRLKIVWLDGQDHSDFVLEKDQVILSEAVFRALGLGDEADPVFQMNITNGQKIPLRVVGYYTNYSYEQWVNDGLHDQSGSWYAPMILSVKFQQFAQLDNEDYYQDHNKPQSYATYVQIHSDRPEEVVKLLETMGYSNFLAIYQYQDAELEGIRLEKQNKAIITCALLLLLGINLYSSFTNAMNDRKYEIGVKRAIGASSWAIVRQYLYESVIVMLANTFLSVGLVADVAIIYKYVVENTRDENGMLGDFVLYLSPYSIGMFATCALTLTVVFSLIFAYKSTRVEIVEYLKSE